MIELELDNLTLAYGRNVVVRDLAFRVVPGEMVGLIGPNGSGKSTVVRALSRVISPVSGRVLVGGRDVQEISRGELACLLGVVPQIAILPGTFTAFEIVLMGRNPHLGFLQHEGIRDMEVAWRAMEMTGTQAFAQRRINELSGGEIQRVVIARVLAQEPKSVLLDEPTASLDISHQVAILDLIKGLCREYRLTVVIVLHDLNLAAQYCDRLILMKEGRLHAQGTPDEVINPRNIKEVYGAEDCVYPHPAGGAPVVLPRAGGGRSAGLT
ncbi:MAG: ABC transporter ATP-binding protein [Dehalococcoidales bacterium]|nr:ABC transporter ATP-binding protein [Dehalococcoidales bacterium]